MNDKRLRELLVEAASYANLFVSREGDWAADFLSGRADIPLHEFEMDSLAAMEFCIAIEANIGVSIVPEELQAIRTLGEMVRRIRHEIPA